MPVEYKVLEWIPVKTADERQQQVYNRIQRYLNNGWKLEGNIIQLHNMTENNTMLNCQALTRIVHTPRATVSNSSSISVNPGDHDPTNLEGGRIKRFTRKRR